MEELVKAKLFDEMCERISANIGQAMAIEKLQAELASKCARIAELEKAAAVPVPATEPSKASVRRK